MLAASLSAEPCQGLDLPALSDLLEEEVALTAEADTVVTATRYAQRVDRTPSNVHVITREEIEAMAPKSAADLLRFVPGLAVLRRQQLGHEVGAAGTGGQYANKVLVLLDGHRMTEPGFGSIPWVDLPVVVDELQRVEVVFGPESTVYGTNAFAAVVNFITRTRERDPASTFRVAGGNRGYSTATLHSRQPLGDGMVSATFQAEKRGGFGPLVTGFDLPDPGYPSGEGIERRVARLSHELPVGEGRTLHYSIAATHSDLAEVPHLPGAPRAVMTHQEGTYLAAEYEQSLGPERSLTLRSSFYRLARDQGAPSLLSSGVLSSVLDSSLADLEVRLRHRWGAWSTVTGATTRRVTQVGYLVDPGDDDARTTELFAQGERDFGDRFVLYLGARQVLQDLADDELSWKVAGLYRPRRDTAWRLSIGTSFRQPDLITDRFVTTSTLRGQALNGLAFAGNPGIQSEVARNFLQLGWERRWDASSLKVNAYTAKLERLIQFRPFGPLLSTVTPPIFSLGRPGLRFENVLTPARVKGLTVSGTRELGAFRLQATYTVQDVDDLPGFQDAPYAPPRVGSLQLLLPPSPERRWSGSLALHGVGPVEVDPDALLAGAAPTLGGWATADLALTRRLSGRLRATLAVRDLLDQSRRNLIYSLLGGAGDKGARFGREVWLGVTFDL